ncbi:hypothetical protein Mp_2g04960 [Marchantia polymorpha subsp. ruderalis]|uniref:Uncharacterized protein n=1 Tax=Marchantia polymorpha TaxID=3197 RepID=A0A2R6X7V7_MARPO|nr:hypothetical protein MARPO_0031s0151 [Marchantia polymorpha]BBN01137.1 hypothetical protein Mp_2g04960 [Marchantia polymorpha subsp. ruderalis]|eukprot:PTQ42186.1 hypothetical protein MARPO_0031s0151 [Marchantia polymorpha]
MHPTSLPPCLPPFIHSQDRHESYPPSLSVHHHHEQVCANGECGKRCKPCSSSRPSSTQDRRRLSHTPQPTPGRVHFCAAASASACGPFPRPTRSLLSFVPSTPALQIDDTHSHLARATSACNVFLTDGECMSLRSSGPDFSPQQLPEYPEHPEPSTGSPEDGKRPETEFCFSTKLAPVTTVGRSRPHQPSWFVRCAGQGGRFRSPAVGRCRHPARGISASERSAKSHRID